MEQLTVEEKKTLSESTMESHGMPLTVEEKKLADTANKIAFVSEHKHIIELAIQGAIEEMKKEFATQVLNAKEKSSLKFEMLKMAAQMNAQRGGSFKAEEIIEQANKLFSFCVNENYEPSKIYKLI